MSIATDRKLFDAALKYSLSSQSLEDLYNYMMTEAEVAFKAGVAWAASQPVTEEEIEAAARELWRDAFYRRARPSGTVQDFDDLTEKDRQHLTHAAQAMLSAARKQVSDE